MFTPYPGLEGIFVAQQKFPCGVFKNRAWNPEPGREPEVVFEDLMHDEELNDRDAQEIAGIVDRYESMLATNTSTFFDVVELEALIEHYLQHGRHKQARQVVNYAGRMYPESLILQLREAQLMAGSGDVMDAIPRLQNLLAFEPSNDEIHLTLATLYAQTDQHREAIHHFRKALDLGDRMYRGDLFIDIALEYENIGLWERAVAVLQEALSEDPSNETALHELGFCFETTGRHDQAIAAFEAFIDEHPYSCPGWYNLGNALQRVGRHADAVDAYGYALAIDEEFSPAMLQKAAALTMMEDYTQALECYRESILMDAPQANTYTLMGECMERMGKLNEATDYYQCALELDGEFADAHVGLGVVAEMRQEWAASLKCFERAMELEPTNVEYHLLLGGILKKIGMHDEAALIYANALRLEPQNLEVYLEAAANLQAAECHEDALEMLQEVPEASQSDSLVVARTFISLYSTGRHQSAFLLLDTALRSTPDLCATVAELFPEVRQDATFARCVLNTKTAQ